MAPTLGERAHGFFFLFAIYWVVLVGTMVLGTPWVVLAWLPSKPLVRVSRLAISTAAYLVFTFFSVLLEWWCGIEFVVTGDLPAPTEKAVVSMNHNCRLDWMFAWVWYQRCNSLWGYKVVLKDLGKKIPGLGWGLQIQLFIFLARSAEQDLPWMRAMARHLFDTAPWAKILIFPEGTDLSPGNIKRSHEWSAKQSPPKPARNRVLYPRVKGLHALLEDADEAVSLYDVTIAYTGMEKKGGRPSEPGVGTGQYPKKCYLHSTKCPSQEFPRTEPQVQAWLDKSFTEKEKALEAFHSNVEQGTDAHLAPPSSTQHPHTSTVTYALVLAFWIVATWATLYGFCASSWFRYYLLVVSVLYTAATVHGIGAEGLDRLLVEKNFGKEKLNLF